MTGVLDRIEAYYDAVPRAVARAETLGPFTLFVNQGPGWKYYARPSLGASEFTAEDVRRVQHRQRALDVPQSFEWVAETSPGLSAAIESAGLHLHTHPLLVLEPALVPTEPLPLSLEARLVTLDDDLALHNCVAEIAFSNPTGGHQGVRDLLIAAAKQPVWADDVARRRLFEDRTIMAAAYSAGYPVSIGSHQPVDGVSEVVGVATLPEYRRRGMASTVMRLLIEDTERRGLDIVFLSAADDAAARIYERVGFRRVATACIAEAA